MIRIREIIDVLKYSNPRPVFCPKCNSPKIKLKENYGILPQIYNCEKCGYEGYIILELEKEKKEP